VDFDWEKFFQTKALAKKWRTVKIEDDGFDRMEFVGDRLVYLYFKLSGTSTNASRRANSWISSMKI
jgi:hypothetical protein